MSDALYNYTQPQLVQLGASHGCGADAQSGCCCGSPEVDCKPIECVYDSDYDENRPKYRICCNANGCCCKYPCSCRNPFWPEFAHPRWLCCRDLYNGEAESCCGND